MRYRSATGRADSHNYPGFARFLKAVTLDRDLLLLTLPGQAVAPRNFLTGDGVWNLNMRVGRTVAFGRAKGGSKGAAAVDPGMAPASASLGPRPQGGGGGGGGERRFSANFNVLVNNVFNHVTRSGFVGNLSSPLFGQATTLGLFRETSNCRRIQFGTQLSF